MQIIALSEKALLLCVRPSRMVMKALNKKSSEEARGISAAGGRLLGSTATAAEV